MQAKERNVGETWLQEACAFEWFLNYFCWRYLARLERSRESRYNQ